MARSPFRPFVTVVAVAALAGGLLSVVPILPAHAAPAARADVPLIPATAITTPKPAAVTGDFGNRAPLPVSQPVTKKAKVAFDDASASAPVRDEYSSTETDKNGVKKTVADVLPVNVLSGGTWVPSVTDLTSGIGGVLGSSLHPLAPRFGATADATRLLHVARAGSTLDFRLEGATGAPSKHSVLQLLNLGADTVSYANALPGVDLSYEVSASSVKESMLLATAPTSAPTYTWTVTGSAGLNAERDAVGNLQFVDTAGDVVFAMPAPVMWDSSPKGGEQGGDIVGVPYDVTPLSTTTWRISITPSASWLADPARVYPVTVDPTVNPSGDNTHSYKSDGNYNNGHALVGNNKQSAGCCLWRTTVHYNYEQLFGQQLTSAVLRTALYSGTAGCFGMSINWAGSFTYNGAGPAMGSMTNCGTGTNQSGEIGGYVNQWVNNSQSGSYIFLTGDESNNLTYQALNTSMVFTSVGQPVMSGISGPVNGARAGIQPVLSATASDPTGGG